MCVIVKPHFASLQCSQFCTNMSNKGRDACPRQVQYVFNTFIGYLSPAILKQASQKSLFQFADHETLSNQMIVLVSRGDLCGHDYSISIELCKSVVPENANLLQNREYLYVF